MEINAFAEALRQEVSRRLGEQYTAEIREIEKNNGVVLQGLMIYSEKINVSPTIYIDSFEEAYEKGASLEEIVDGVVELYMENTPKESIDMDFFKSFDRVKDRICCRLISAEKNRKLLEQIPNVPFLDLAVCFYYAYEGKDLGSGIILLYNSHMEMWGISAEELMTLAGQNTPRLYPWECIALREMLKQMGVDESGEKNEPAANILTNRQKMYGAACVLYPGVLEKLAEEAAGGLYLLPSSVHEMLLIADNEVQSPGRLREVVTEANRTQTAPEEFLSDKLYYYDNSQKRLKIIF